ncbi:hypothetical protein [Pedobacter foliorum]|uniref:hypothetical protein n=1 Tax=Pedobacter foliorum TaxID=2739058 RepID=UPI0015634420|nr:hypothetical protein [Pedobacter foliorum]NRF40414.1 hypothetical protein [Pedobacter foliorum]
MIAGIPLFVNLFFVLTVLFTLFLFHGVVKNSSSITVSAKANRLLIVLIIWLIVQSVLALNHVFSIDTTSFPPKIALIGVLPAILTIILVFLTKSGRNFIDELPILNLTYVHMVRIPVEITLYLLFMYGAVPELMTFEGRNFDILAGISSPLVAYFGITKGKMAKGSLLAWNVICLFLLLNIVVNALLSAPSPLQKFGFDQPNIGVLYFPFSLLPAFIVPVVLFSHLVSIRQLLINKVKA